MGLALTESALSLAVNLVKACKWATAHFPSVLRPVDSRGRGLAD